MKKTKALAAAAAAVLSASALSAVSSAERTWVTVNISDGSGGVAAVSFGELSDKDGDGALTINDALIFAHEDALFPGGAEAGYASEETEYGLSLTKLWGIENGGAYGYYVNDVSAMSLLDPVKDGDYIYAFVYSDTAGFSDMYSYFDKKEASLFVGDTLTLTLKGAAYDENWNPVTVPIAGAELLIQGEKTGIFTDENGTASITVSAENAGALTVRAVSDTQTLVPPICRVNVLEREETAAPSENPPTGITLSFAVPALAALAVYALGKRND